MIKSTSSTSTGKSIFLPAAGYKSAGASYSVGAKGCYQCSTTHSNSSSVSALTFESGSHLIGDKSRTEGYSVRPVLK